jgi:HK97 family phage portal protein
MNALARLFMPGKFALGRWSSWLSPTDSDDSGESLAGVSITRESSIAISAVYACIRVIAGTIGSLPVDTLERRGPVRLPVDRPAWLDRPEPRNPNVTRVVHMSRVVASMLFDGNAYTLATPSVYEPVELRILDPRHVTIKANPDGSPLYILRKGSEYAELSESRIIHTPLPMFMGSGAKGIAPLEACRQGMALSLASERFGAKFFENGTILSGVIQVAGPMAQQDQDDLRERWAARYGGVKNAHKPGVLTQGAEWKPLGITPEQAQFIEIRRYQAEDMARLYGVPPSIIGITIPGAVSYASVEQQNLQFVNFTLRNIVESIEASYQRLIPGPTTFLKFNMRALLRGDSAARGQFYAALANIGAIVPDEVRALEDYSPIAGGRLPRVQLNTASSATADAKAQADAYKTLIDAGYPESKAAAVVGLPAPTGG